MENKNGIHLNAKITNEFVGYFEFGKGVSVLKLFFAHKPYFIHRFFMKILLGFKWVNL